MPTITTNYSGTISLQSRYYVDYKETDMGDTVCYASRGPYSETETINLSYAIPAGEKINSIYITATISGGSVSGANGVGYGANQVKVKINTNTVAMRNSIARFPSSVLSADLNNQDIDFSYCVSLPAGATSYDAGGSSTIKIGTQGWHYSNITISDIQLNITYGEVGIGTPMPMGKTFQIGVNNIARDVENVWIGVNNVARKAKTIWMGDNAGKAKQVWPANKMYPIKMYQVTNTATAVSSYTNTTGQGLIRHSDTASYRRGVIFELPDLTKIDYDICAFSFYVNGLNSSGTTNNPTSFSNGYASTFPALKFSLCTPSDTIPAYANAVSALDEAYVFNGCFCGWGEQANVIAGTRKAVIYFNKEDLDNVMIQNGGPSDDGRIWLFCRTDSASTWSIADTTIAGNEPYIYMDHPDGTAGYSQKAIWCKYNASKNSSTHKVFELTSDNPLNVTEVSSVKLRLTFWAGLSTNGSSSSGTKYTFNCYVGTSSTLNSDTSKRLITLNATNVWHSYLSYVDLTITDPTQIAALANGTLYIDIYSTSSSTFVPAYSRIQIEARAFE